jgi:diguanylate cyclase (GGDEF)-like protein
MLAAVVDAAAEGETGELALLIIDLDDFKQVNDTLGHQAGDELLIEIAERLRRIAGEFGVASRFGGNEFAVLLYGLASQADADPVAEEVCRRLQEPVQLSTGIVTVGGSVGLVGGSPGATAGDLMRCADIAMYSAKAGGKNRVERFTEDRHGKFAHIRLLEDHLAEIVTRDEIVLHYQPLIDLETGWCVAMEVLTRWQHPTLGMLMPSEFMSLAERHGLTGDLGAHILRLSCRQLKSLDGPGASA